MGCLHSRSKCTNDKAALGSNGTQDQQRDSEPPSFSVQAAKELGLTQKQVFSFKQSWKGIKRRMEDTGVEMFVRLFKTNASLQKMFQGFKDIRSDDDLRSNEALEYHATLVMTTLDDAITHIDNYDYVRQLLQKTGASHVKFTGFQPDNFMAIKEPFLEAVKVTLGDRYTENMQNIYTIAITFILQSLVGGIQEALAKEEDEKRGSNGVV
ncbi:hypothetical protein BsWGS_10417 [Bradybaena similaris]